MSCKGCSLSDGLEESVVIGPEAYVSQAYAQSESDRLWRKVWQIACRAEEIPSVGDYIVYDIMDDTIVVVRSGLEEISAFHNVCAHRGKRIAEGEGHAKHFRCSYHGWRYDLQGKNIFIQNKDDWSDAITQDRADLLSVRADIWAGFVWINMDNDCQNLREYLEPAASMLDPFELNEMRYRWRMRCRYPSNWKTALEAFLEPYHVEATHPQLMKFASYYAWSKVQGIHSNSGYGGQREDSSEDDVGAAFSSTLMRPGNGDDARLSIWQLQEEIWRTTDATTTQVFVDAARRLVDELPEGLASEKVMAHWIESARNDDAKRGVIWPNIDPSHISKAGSSWHIFPNVNIIQGLNNALYYRVRPCGSDPDSCIFEAVALERFPAGQEPAAGWIDADTQEDRELWPPVLLQDFDNISNVQKGMKSIGFRGAIPNPKQERKISNFHRNLSKYMEIGAPIRL